MCSSDLLRGEIPASVYQRIQTKITTVTEEIDKELQKIEQEKQQKQAQPKKTKMQKNLTGKICKIGDRKNEICWTCWIKLRSII